MTEHIVKVLQRSQLSHSQTDVKPFIYMHSKWLEDAIELQLFITTSNTSYKAILKHDEIRSAAEELEQPYDEFFAECKKALTMQMGLPGFDYELDEQQAQFKLWKCTGFETLYVEVSLRKVSNVHQLLDAAIECGQNLSTTIPSVATVASSQSESAASQPNELAAEYEQYIKDSKLQEKKLLKKFLLLLNSKKQRIEELERQLERHRNTAADTDTDVEDVQPENENTDDDSDFGGATQALTQKEAMQE
ncbi:uncharacterized protein LOC117786853 [Drosophila innubila]|uniref:uncharacterized protein LOC117786853 n=1 Tax=Drosophila innubila TaxID=198719 RepID=UPI00148C0A17|nr:uncharacterized protein LOC117786853 [Drosophila innubila]